MRKLVIGAVVQARVGSSRLPGKVLKKIGSLTILEHVLERLKLSNKVDHIIIATTDSIENDALETIALKYNVSLFKGDENNVLKRIIDCSDLYHLDVVVRICADSPFIDPKYIDLMIEEYLSLKKTQNIHLLTVDSNQTRLLDGIEITSLDSLKYFLAKSGDAKKYLEHVTLYIKENEVEKRFYFSPPQHLRRVDICINIDFPDDLEKVRHLFQYIYDIKGSALFSIDDLLNHIEPLLPF